MRTLRSVLFLVAAGTVVPLSGCGSPSYHTYTDATYKFSFEYPSGWSAPTAKQGIADSVPSHIVTANGASSQVRVVVNERRPDFSGIADGQVEHQGPNTLTFTHMAVAGKPGILIVQQTAGLPADHEYVHFNTNSYGYDIETISANGINKSEQADFMHVVKSFKLGAKS